MDKMEQVHHGVMAQKYYNTHFSNLRSKMASVAISRINTVIVADAVILIHSVFQ